MPLKIQGFLLLLSVSCLALADNPTKGLDTVTVTADRPQQAADEQLAQDVKKELRSNPIVDDNHVTITVKNGVVTMQGFVQDAWDLWALRRVAKKVPGVRKIVNDVELVLNDQ
jgi:osmotically-inducible protein OsmY